MNLNLKIYCIWPFLITSHMTQALLGESSSYNKTTVLGIKKKQLIYIEKLITIYKFFFLVAIKAIKMFHEKKNKFLTYNFLSIIFS